MSDIIYTPPASSGGGQNPTTNYIPLNNGTSSFVDSNIYNNVGNFIATTFLGNDAGIYLNYNNGMYEIGDYAYNNSGTKLVVDDTYLIISTFSQNNQKGLKLDFANDLYFFGDFNGVSGTNSSLTIDNNNGRIYTQGYLSEDGINIDFSTKQYFFGDFNAIGNGTYFWINDNNNEMRTYLSNTFIGLSLYFGSYTFSFGDFNSTNNATYLQIKDNNKAIVLNTNGGEISQTADLLRFSGALTTPTASGSSGDHLQVTINGTPYVIALLNP